MVSIIVKVSGVSGVVVCVRRVWCVIIDIFLVGVIG